MPFRYLAVLAVSSSGVFIGILLSYFTQQEIKEGRSYLFLFLKFITAVILGIAGFTATASLLAASAILAAALALSLLPLREDIFTRMAFPIYALLFFASSKTPYFLATASSIFLAGLPAGSLLGRKSIFPTLLFIIIGGILGFI